jgi:hypothetical protein
MPILRVQFTIWRLMTAVAVMAVVCRFGGAPIHYLAPRTCLPLVTALYLTWVCCDCLGNVCTTPILSRPRTYLSLSSQVLLALAALAVERRWTDFDERACFHDSEAHLCRRIAEGEHGRWIACGEESCVVTGIPPAQSEEDRTEKRRLADYHARLAKYYRSRW